MQPIHVLSAVVLLHLGAGVLGKCTEEELPNPDIVSDRITITTTSENTNTTFTIQATPAPLLKNTSDCQCVLTLKDCKAWYNFGARENKVYYINPDDGEPFQVYCDMVTDGGGWIVFQRRLDGSVDFYRDWANYKKGFGTGNLTGEFWLGLEKIYRLTKTGNKQLRIDLGDFENNYRYASYSSFSIGDHTTDYTLHVSGYTGNAGDTLESHWETANGSKFSTKDQDNDVASGSCAIQYSGAWWYYSCHGANLNGLYLKGKHSSYADGVEWTTWKGYYYSLRFTEMKLK